MQKKLTKSQKELIEKMGVCSERTGATPVESRIMGLLLIAEEPELTFENIIEILSISKSAASNALNKLLSSGHIDYLTLPGDRRRYFYANLNRWEGNFRQKFQNIFEVNTILKEILAQRPKSSKQFNLGLKNLIGFIDFVQTEMPVILRKGEKLNHLQYQAG